jgi:hypothetical protein
MEPIRINSDGLHMQVFQRNHGMHTRINRVTLTDVASDVSPSTLTVSYTGTDTGLISVGNTNVFGQFEGVSVLELLIQDMPRLVRKLFPILESPTIL